jgi:hypothetical protein
MAMAFHALADHLAFENVEGGEYGRQRPHGLADGRAGPRRVGDSYSRAH